MNDKINISFVDRSGKFGFNIPISSYHVPAIGHRVQLNTGPASSVLPDGSAVGRSLELWKVVNVTWDAWLTNVTIEVRPD